MRIENKPLAIGVAVFLVGVIAVALFVTMPGLSIKVDLPAPVTPAGGNAP